MNERSNRWRSDGAQEAELVAPPLAPPVLADPLPDTQMPDAPLPDAQVPEAPPLPTETAGSDGVFSFIAVGLMSVACLAIATLTYCVWQQLDVADTRVADATKHVVTKVSLAPDSSPENSLTSLGLDETESSESREPQLNDHVVHPPLPISEDEIDEVLDKTDDYTATSSEKSIAVANKLSQPGESDAVDLPAPPTDEQSENCVACTPTMAPTTSSLSVCLADPIDCPNVSFASTGECTTDASPIENELTENQFAELESLFDDLPPPNDERRYGTELTFAESLQTARQQAAQQEKLLLVLHVSGNFAIEGFT